MKVEKGSLDAQTVPDLGKAWYSNGTYCKVSLW